MPSVQIKPGKQALKPRAPLAPTAQTVTIAVERKENAPSAPLPKTIAQTADKSDVAELRSKLKDLEIKLNDQKKANVALQSKIVDQKEYQTKIHPSADVDAWAEMEDTPIAPNDWRLTFNKEGIHNKIMLLTPYDVDPKTYVVAVRSDLDPIPCITMIPCSLLPTEPTENARDLIDWRLRKCAAIWTQLSYQKDPLTGKLVRDAAGNAIISGVIGTPGYLDEKMFAAIYPYVLEEESTEATEATEANTAPSTPPVTPTEAPTIAKKKIKP